MLNICKALSKASCLITCFSFETFGFDLGIDLVREEETKSIANESVVKRHKFMYEYFLLEMPAETFKDCHFCNS